MSFWQVVIPTAADVQNLITNPSTTTATGVTGYTAAGAARAFDGTLTRYGVGSFKLTPTAATFDGFYYSVSLVNGVTYNASAAIFGAIGVPYRIYFANSTGSTVLGSQTAGSTTGTGYWGTDRVVASYTAASTGSFRIYVAKNNSNSTAPFWVDGVMLQTADPAMTYIDGKQPGCSWDGLPNASTSTLSAQSREGGILTDLSTMAIAVEQLNGVGMAPVNNIILNYGLQDGGFYQNTRALPRVFSLQMDINTNSLQPGASLNTLHLNRKEFIDAVKSDLVAQPKPFWLRYTGTLKPMWIKGVYDDGLGTQYGNGWVETPAPKIVCPDPFWQEEGNDGFTTAGSTSLGTDQLFYRNSSGVWSAVPGGPIAGGPVLAYATAADGSVFMAGQFTSANAAAMGLIAKWNGSTFSALTSGGSNGISGSGAPLVRALCVDPSGNLYAGGTFQHAGSTLAINIAKWDGSTWTSLGSGTNNGILPSSTGSVYDMVIGNNGNLYVCGAFNQAGSISTNMIGITMWDGAAWNTVGSGLTSGGQAYSMAQSPNGTLYMSGSFSAAGGVSANNIAYWDGTNWNPLGSGLNGPVYSITFGDDGILYAAGSFSASGTQTMNHVAQWNGSTWSPMSTGVGSVSLPAFYPTSTYLNRNGNITILGNYAGAGALSNVNYEVEWNGSSFVHPEERLSVNTGAVTSGFDNGKYAFKSAGVGTTSVGPNVVSVNNKGSSRAYPIITIDGPGQIFMLRNVTTGATVYFNLTLLTGETVTFDTTPGNISFTSNYRGNMKGYILPGSNFTTFNLLPGINSLLIMAATGTNTVTARWDNRHWSVDGGAS